MGTVYGPLPTRNSLGGLSVSRAVAPAAGVVPPGDGSTGAAGADGTGGSGGGVKIWTLLGGVAGAVAGGSTMPGIGELGGATGCCALPVGNTGVAAGCVAVDGGVVAGM